jgi:hypothetical protein
MKTFIILVLIALFLHASIATSPSSSWYGEGAGSEVDNLYNLNLDNGKSQTDSQHYKTNQQESENHSDWKDNLEKDLKSNLKKDSEKSSNVQKENNFENKKTNANENDYVDQLKNKLTFAKENSDTYNKLNNLKYADDNNDADESEVAKKNSKKISKRNADIKKSNSYADHAEVTDNAMQDKGLDSYGGHGGAATNNAQKYHQQNHKFNNDDLAQSEGAFDLETDDQLSKRNWKRLQNSKQFENTNAEGKGQSNTVYFDSANDNVKRRSSKVYDDDSEKKNNIYSDQQYQRNNIQKDLVDRVRQNSLDSNSERANNQNHFNSQGHSYGTNDGRNKKITNDQRTSYQPSYNHGSYRRPTIHDEY